MVKQLTVFHTVLDDKMIQWCHVNYDDNSQNVTVYGNSYVKAQLGSIALELYDIAVKHAITYVEITYTLRSE